MLIESKFDKVLVSHPRSMDTSKREKPPEVKNLLKIPSIESNPITEEDSEFLSSFGLVPNNYQDLLDNCTKQVQSLRQWNMDTKKLAKSLEKNRLHKILKKDPILLFKFMILLRHKSKLNQDPRSAPPYNSSSTPPYFGPRISTIFCKLVRRKCISLRTVKMVCIVLVKSNIVPESWLDKPFDKMEAKLWKNRPPESFWLNKSACDDAERAYYEKLSKCKVASSMTEGSDPPTTANDTMIHQFIDLTIK